MNIKVAKVLIAVVSLLLASLACNALSGGALLKDDFSGGDITWGTGTDADSSVEYSNAALNFVVNKDLYFVWSTPNTDQSRCSSRRLYGFGPRRFDEGPVVGR